MAAVFIAMLTHSGGLQAKVVGDVVMAGFKSGAGNLYRPGYWVPVVLDLQTTGARLVEVDASLAQKDRDGDTVVAHARQVVLQPGHAPRKVRLACVAAGGTLNLPIFGIRITDHATGELLAALAPRAGGNLVALQEREILIVSLSSENKVLRDIRRTARGATLRGRHGTRKLPGYRHSIKISPVAPELLPERWWYFEAVDYIFWNNPDVTRVTEEQIAALGQWVSYGGTLVVGVGSERPRIADSPLAALLPGKLIGSGEQSVSSSGKRRAGLTFAVVEPDPDAEVTRDRRGRVVAVRMVRGLGLVVLLPCSMNDHQTWTGWRLEQYDRLLGLVRRATAGDALLAGGPETANLTNVFLRNIDFVETGRAYLAWGVLFVIAYVLISTLGTWGWLGVKGRLHHSWSAMMLCAIVAGAISMVGVTFIRGVLTGVKSVAVVDGRAGDTAVRTRLYYGLRIPRRVEVDVDMPGAEYIRPLSAEPGKWSSFAATSQYDLDLGDARLRGVPIRATLKQFEAVWKGDLGGGIAGKVVVSAHSVDDLPGSSGTLRGGYITNSLGVDLDHCYLIRAWNRPAPAPSLKRGAARADLTYQPMKVHAIGKLLDGQRIELTGIRAPSPGIAVGDDLPKFIYDVMRKSFGAFDPTMGLGRNKPIAELPKESDINALLTLSLLWGYAPDRLDEPTRRAAETWGGPLEPAQRLARTLERARRLGNRHALLIGFSRGRPPAALRIDGNALRCDDALIMYRFLVPLVPQPSGS